jgi:hypothetical protein
MSGSNPKCFPATARLAMAQPTLMNRVRLLGSTKGKARLKSANTEMLLSEMANFQGWVLGPDGAKIA